MWLVAEIVLKLNVKKALRKLVALCEISRSVW